MNATLIELANNSAPLVIRSVVETNKSQFWTSILVSLVISFWFILYFAAQNGSMKSLVAKIKLSLLTKRPTLVVAHNATGLFDASMIDQKTLNKITKFLAKNHSKEVNLVLHTPGGSIFHSMAASTAINKHGKVHVYVPVMAMSGGTLLALSAYTLRMSPAASLGPVDPQVGLIWTQGSADDWKKVIKAKGSKAGDTAHIMHNEGQKYTSLIADHFRGLGASEEVIEELTGGISAHGKRYSASDVSSWGVVPGFYPLFGEEYRLCVLCVT